MPITLDQKQLKAVMAKLDALDDPKVFKPPMTQSVKHLQRELKQKPGKAAGAFTAMATPGQRRAYWARVRNDPSMHGANGYNRTGNTAAAWTTKVSANGRRGEVGNIKPAAKWLYDEVHQQPFHEASGWPRVDKVAEKETPAIVKIFERAYARLISK